MHENSFSMHLCTHILFLCLYDVMLFKAVDQGQRDKSRMDHHLVQRSWTDLDSSYVVDVGHTTRETFNSVCQSDKHVITR